MVYLREADELARAGRAEGITFTRLKGLALVDALYPDLGARSLADIDLLVREGEWDTAKALALRQGFRELPGIPPEYRAYKITYIKRLDGAELMLDLHRKLLYGEPEGFEWQRDGDRLSKTDLLAYLAGHAGYQHGFLGLNWMLDLSLLVESWRTPADWPDWDRLSDVCDRVGLHQSMRAAVHVLKEHLGTRIPAGLQAFVRCQAPMKQHAAALALSERYLWHSTGRHLRYFLVQNLVKDSWSEALEHDWLWLRRRLWKITSSKRIS
jgi:hypothetical protein